MFTFKDTNKFAFFRKVQMWPIAVDFDYEAWLDNFVLEEERKIAERILDSFIYIPEAMVNQMLKTVVGRCGYYFSKVDCTWTHDSFKNDCWYSFIQGEKANDVTDSGYLFIRKLRDELGIPSSRILDFKTLLKKLETSIEPLNVILVDDFVGSGAQCDCAWNEHKLESAGMTLSDLVLKKNHKVAYAPLVSNIVGYNRILKKCSGLHLECLYKLGDEYSLLNKDGICWNGDEELFNKWIKMLYRVAIQEKIPIEEGRHVNDMLGFCAQGLAIAFYHGIPDACPAFFYWNSSTWNPLKKRHYHRD